MRMKKVFKMEPEVLQLTDWNYMLFVSIHGKLTEALFTMPRQCWSWQDMHRNTLLHYACGGPNVAAMVALLTSGLVDVNARNGWGIAPAHYAASFTQPRAVEVLCAAGANMLARDDGGRAPIDYALRYAQKESGEIVRVLMANGVRLSTVNEVYITPELEAFERGVLRCRAVVVAMLRVKKAANLYHVDKFLMRELAYAMWATRTCDRWQK